MQREDSAAPERLCALTTHSGCCVQQPGETLSLLNHSGPRPALPDSSFLGRAVQTEISSPMYRAPRSARGIVHCRPSECRGSLPRWAVGLKGTAKDGAQRDEPSGRGAACGDNLLLGGAAGGSTVLPGPGCSLPPPLHPLQPPKPLPISSSPDPAPRPCAVPRAVTRSVPMC